MTDTESTATALVDVQARRPELALSLSRVGVTGVEKVIRLQSGGTEQLFMARFECVIELGLRTEGRPHVPLRGGGQRVDRRGRAR